MRRLAHTLPRRLARFLSGVRIRMTLWYLAILALVFVIFGAIVSATTIQQDQAAQRSDLTTFATTLSATYDATHGTLQIQDPWDNVCNPSGKQQQVGKQVSTTPFVPGDIVVLLNAGGDPVQTFGPLSAQAVIRIQTLTIQYGSTRPPGGIFTTIGLPTAVCGGNVSIEPYTLHLTPIMDAGQHIATLVVGQPTQSTRTLSALVPGLLIAGPLTLLVAALGGYWLATRALRPVRLIARTAEEIEESDLSRRLNLKSHDELGALAATFDRMLARLEAAFARQRQFTGDASHELRTPLSIVAAEAERALAAPRRPEEYRRALEIIHSENAYMGQLVEQLLTLARADAGQLRLRDDPLDLSDVALEVVERLAPLARERGVVLSVGELPELRVHGDRTALGLLLGNLVENAIKYAGQAGRAGRAGRAGQAPGGRVRVETGTVDRDGGQCVAWVRVEDDGPGIAPEHLPHLFERFYRADAARTRTDGETLGDESGDAPQGSGLGLAIAHEIARAHGGAMRVESIVDCGTSFTLELPAD